VENAMWQRAKYIIWHTGAPVCTGYMDDVRIISNWVYSIIESITGDSEQAVEASSWVELAVIGDSYVLPDYELELTVSEVD